MMSCVGLLGVGAAKESIFLGESHFREESGGRRDQSGRDAGCQRDRRRTWKMRDVREVVNDEGEDTVADDGGGTGMGDKVASTTGSTGSEVTISRYLSWLNGDIDRKIGEKMGSRVSAGRRVTYVRKPCR